jgi:hypothetical protein
MYWQSSPTSTSPMHGSMMLKLTSTPDEQPAPQPSSSARMGTTTSA